MRHKRFIHLALVFMAAVLLLTISPMRTARAAPTATCTFTSIVGSVNWGTNASWLITGAGCPVTGSTFPGNTTGNTDNVVILSLSTVSLNVSPTNAIGALTVSASALGSNGLTIAGTNTLTTGAITINAPSSGTLFSSTIAVGTGTLNAASVTLNGNSDSSLLAVLSVSSGTINVTGNITSGGTVAQTRLTFSGTGVLNIGGNFGPVGVFTPSTGTVNFNGSGVQTVTGNFTFNNLTVSSGAIMDIGTNTVSASGTLSNLGTIRANRAVSATGTFTFSLAGGPINGANLSINVTTQGSLSNLQVDRRDSNHPNATAPLQTGYYWLITPTGVGYTANLTLPTNFTPDANGDDKVCRYTGSGVVWDCAMNSVTANSITRNGVTTFSPWAAGNQVGPTAVSLNQISAAVNSNWLLLSLVGFMLLLTGWQWRNHRKV